MGFVWNTIHSSIQVPVISLSITMPIQKKVFYLGCSLYLYCHKCIFISYLFLIFSYLLLYLHHCLCYYAYAICSYLILCTPFSFFILDQTLSIHYLFIVFSKVWLGILSLLFLVISCHSFSSITFYCLFLFSGYQTLSGPKGCTGSSPYRYFLYSTQP